MKTVFTDRIRFNWGFHDATSDKERGRDRRTIGAGELFCLPARDAAYRAGYEFGQCEDISRGRPESSALAWGRHIAEEIESRAISARVEMGIY